MIPLRSIAPRCAWPPRAARLLAASRMRGRLTWLPLWLAWRRARTTKAAAARAGVNLPGHALSLTLSVGYRFERSLPWERVAAALPARGDAGSVPRFVQRSPRLTFAAFARSPTTWCLRQRPERALVAGVADSAARRILEPVTRARTIVAIAALHGVQRGAAPSGALLVPMPRTAGRYNWPPERREHARDRLPTSRGQSGNGRNDATSAARRVPPDRPIPLRYAGIAAAVANGLTERTPLVLSSRAAARSAPQRHQIPSERHQIPSDPTRFRVALNWRGPVAETGARISDGRMQSSRSDSAATATRRAPAASEMAAARVLEPAVAERLVQDVIRRVDRRLRIERERRGL
jgi:hypothetical protein